MNMTNNLTSNRRLGQNRACKIIGVADDLIVDWDEDTEDTADTGLAFDPNTSAV